MGHGGARPGAGRKRNDPPTRARKVYLSDDQVRLLRLWGRGDVSLGLRWLIGAATPLVRRRAELAEERARAEGQP